MTAARPLPRTRSCFVCGVENPHGLHARSRVEGGVVILEYTTRPADCGYREIVHGGLLMTLLDEVMAWAAIEGNGRVCVAAELTTRLLQPVGIGERLRVEGRVAEDRGRIVQTEGVVLLADGRRAARATGRYVPMPPDRAAACTKDFVGC